jgi:hypothetical protein
MRFSWRLLAQLQGQRLANTRPVLTAFVRCAAWRRM